MRIPLYALVITAGLLFGAGYFFGSKNPAEHGHGMQQQVGTKWETKTPLSQQNPPAAVAAAKDSLVGLNHSEVKSLTLSALAEPDRILRWAALMKVLAGMNASNAAAVTEAVKERHATGADTRSEGEMIQFREGQVLKEAAMKDLPAEPNGKPGYVLMIKMKGWASMGPESAKLWLESLEPGTAKETLMGKWREGLSEAGPKVLAGIFPSLPPDQQRSLVGNMLTGLIGEGGFPAVESWYRETSKTADPMVVNAAFSDIVNRMTQDPGQWDATVTFIKSQAETLDMSALNFSTINRRMAPQNPGKCLELLHDLTQTSPAIQSRVDSIIIETVEQSTSTSLNNLGTWLNEHREHPLYDRTVQQFAQQTRADDLDSAMRWAGTIKDETLRAQTIATLQSQ